MPRPAAPTRRPTAPPPAQQFEIVDPRWLLRALGICFALAFVCGYATLCFLFYQGAWQFVLHPSRTVDRTPAAIGLAYEPVNFDASETGQPRLTGWWIPATAQSSNVATILYLHDGTGSLSSTLPALTLLHQANLNVFAIDYRGFGTSDATEHPSTEHMEEDAAAALAYLTATRHIAPATIVPFGTGLGGSLAVELAVTHHELPAVIVDNPDPDPAATALAAHPSNLVPVRLLFGDQFAITKPLSRLATPKLLFSGGPLAPNSYHAQSLQALFTSAASPRTTVTLPAGDTTHAYTDALSSFIDQYVHPATAPSLDPTAGLQ